MGGWNRGLTKSNNPTLARWSAERKGVHYSPATEIAKGQRISTLTEFRKGSIPANKKGKHVPVIRPTMSLGYVIGVLLGDGCVYISTKRRPDRWGGTYKIILSVTEKLFADAFAAALESINIHATRGMTKPRGNHRAQHLVIGSNKAFCVWFRSCDLYYLEANTLRDPGTIIGFIRGFYDSEGSVRRGHQYQMTNTNSEVLLLVQRLLLKQGIHAKLNGPHKNDPWKPAYRLYIPIGEGLMFRQLVSPTIKRGAEEVVS